ncbi:glycosyltransferase family 4 protein [Parabacteroides sp. APC149_11_2_Y6]
MKILLLSTGGRIGGEESFTKNLALGLMKKGHQVIVGVGGIIQAADLKELGIRIAPIDITKRTPWGLYFNAKKLVRYVTAEKFDIVDVQAVGPAIMGILAKRLFHCNVLWIWHNHGISSFAYKCVVKYLKVLDLSIGVSDYVLTKMRAYGIPWEKSCRIHNGISLQDFTLKEADKYLALIDIRRSLNIPEKSFLFTYIGRLSPEKGVEVFLRAFEQLYATHNNVYCLLVGDGIQKQALLELIKKFSSGNNIIFAGFRKDIPQVLAASDGLVLPSHAETFSLTALQAFAIGTPIIASDVDGTPEQVLPLFNGLLFKDDDSNDLCLKMSFLLNNPDLAKYYTINARKLSESYLNIDRMIAETEQVYISIKEDRR